MRPLRNLAALVFAACFLLTACAGAASFQHGVIGVRLPLWVGEEAAWSPDGKWIAIPVKTGIRLRNVETDAVRQVEAPPLQGFPEDPGPLSWSADGRTFRYVTKFGPEENNASWATEIRRDGTGLRQMPLGVKAFETDWDRDGWPLVFNTGFYAYDFDKGNIGPNPALYVVSAFGEKPERIVEMRRNIGEGEIARPTLSPDGKHVLYSREQRRKLGIWTVRTDGSGPRLLVSRLVSLGDLAFAPDGRRFAYAGVSEKGDRRLHLYTASLRGGRPRAISDAEILDGPVWSPDGRWLAYSNYEGEIRRLHPNGRGDQLVAELPGQEIRGLRWSPDGRHLAYTARDFPPSD
jgi:Tol biopolymer transport system component